MIRLIMNYFQLINNDISISLLKNLEMEPFCVYGQFVGSLDMIYVNYSNPVVQDIFSTNAWSLQAVVGQVF